MEYFKELPDNENSLIYSFYTSFFLNLLLTIFSRFLKNQHTFDGHSQLDYCLFRINRSTKSGVNGGIEINYPIKCFPAFISNNIIPSFMSLKDHSCIGEFFNVE